jgi:DNA-binding transcriptional regulator YiaG
MPNVGSVLRDEIKRLSRREIRLQTEPTKKATTQNRHHIAALNRKVAQLERQLALLARHATRQQQPSDRTAAGDGSAPKLRFVAKGLRSHRNRLGLSAGDFGKLIGVSANSVYAWESGTTIPRRAQLAKIAALRAMGKREAAQRLSAATRTKSTKRPKR